MLIRRQVESFPQTFGFPDAGLGSLVWHR
jgi:hypothetical protein